MSDYAFTIAKAQAMLEKPFLQMPACHSHLTLCAF